jgi:hypothetical protein
MVDHIGNAANALIPAYLALQSKGYRVSWKRGDSSPDDETWFAEGPLGSFTAEDPVELLGLVAMREERGASWKASDEQIDEFMAKYEH